MRNYRELEIKEMQEISGGNPAYEIGYAIGKTLRDFLSLRTLYLFLAGI